MGHASVVRIMLACTLATPLAAQGPGQRVVPVLYIPADLPFDVKRLELQLEALRDVQEWYAVRLGGMTFFADPLIVQRSRHTFAELAGDNFQNCWPLPEKEFAEYGLPWNDSSRIKLLLLAQGAGAWAGADSENGGFETENDAGRVARGAFGGLAVVGDSTVGGILARVCPRDSRSSFRRPDGGTAWWCNWNTYRGTIAHELGHTFGVPHPDAFRNGFRCDSTVITNMQCHWAFPSDSLLNFETAHFRSLPFFSTAAFDEWIFADPLSADGQRLPTHDQRDALLWLTGRGGGTGYRHGVVFVADTVMRIAAAWEPPAAARWFVADIGLTDPIAEPIDWEFRCGTAAERGVLAPGDPPRTITVPVDGSCTVETRLRTLQPGHAAIAHPRWSSWSALRPR